MMGMASFCYLCVMILCCGGIAYGNYYVVKKIWFTPKMPQNYHNIKEDTDVIIEELDEQNLM